MYFLLLLIPLLAESAKLNVPRVLLPYNHGTASNFTLKVHEGGCYKWTSSRDEVKLSEVFLEGECSNEAVVSAITKSLTRLTAIILAKDIGTGFSLRCDVIVDSIHRLEIVTTTRELFAEEAPEEFEVRAYDLYGNEFSTLEGQVFVWDLQTITDHKAVVAAQTVLRFITFEASPYETPFAIAPLEAIGEQGNRVLIEGRQTGLARLSVRMAHSSYKNLQPAEVNLMVIANLILEPQDVYILPRTIIQYSVFHLKQGVFHPVEIEGSQYYLQISDDSVAALEDDGISASGLSLGTTSVILRDNNVKASQTLKQPTATLNVVDPSYLTITIVPHNNPALIVNYPYTFLINIYDKNNNKIYLTDAIVVETLIPLDFITTEFISKNGTYIEGIPHQIGTTKITAKLTAIEINDEILEISPPLKASLTVDIYDRIKVRPSTVLLPWDPITNPYYNFNLTTEGTHGTVTWSSKDSSLVQVNTLGQCQTGGNGITSVTAALAINPHNNDEAKIYIQEVLHLNILEGKFEMEVDEPLTLAISMGSLVIGSEMLFSQCHQLPLKVVTEEDFYSSEFKVSDVKESCVSVDLSSSNSGFSTVSVSYLSSTGLLESSVIVSAFKPLLPISPTSGETVLAIGTSRLVLFEGGPLPWINKPSSHFAKVEYEKTDLLSAEVIELKRKENPDIHAVFVDCFALGEMNITLHVGNKKSTTLPFPVQASSTIKVICALPDSIILSSATPKKEGCPDSKDVHLQVVAHCYKSFSMNLSVRDSEGRHFDNVSSLSIGWSVSEPTLASFPQEEMPLMNSQIVHGFRVPLFVQQNLLPIGTPGELTVSATVIGFKDPSLKDIQVPRLQDTIKVFLVNDAQLSPPELVLFNHKENQGEVQITGGSGHFKLAKFDEEIAMYEFMPQSNKVIVFPMADGNTTLILRDLCLDFVITPVSVIRISSLGSLELFMRDRVEVGLSITAEVVARDTSGNHIPYHALMNITPHLSLNIIDLSFETVNGNGNAIYRITGKTVGTTSVKISVQKGSSFMHSPPRSLQVFPALTIHPRNLTLIVGAVFQVETRGGPISECTIDFIMENETISSVSYSGVVTAHSLGTTRLTARAIDLHTDGEEIIIYSQDSVIIRVIPLESIHIHAPLKHIETGYSMPLYALGDDNSQNPLAYSTVIPPLLFEWSLSNKVASFGTLYSENGIIESKENQGIVRLKALKPGRVSVSLKVSVSVPHSAVDFQIKNNIVLTDKIEVKVFETLKLKKPINEDGKILLSPNAETKIFTNRDTEGTLSYKVKCNNQSETSSIVSVSSDGVVKAGNRHGDSSILVSLEEQFGVTQSLSILVEVRPISYFEIETVPFMKVAGKNLFQAVPIGVSHELKVLAHDHRGRIFTATKTALEFRSSRFDLANIQRGSSNDTLHVTIRNVGQTVLHVWDNSNPLLADYFKINSGPGIDPDRASVPFGSFVCFSSNLRSTSGETGIWKSDNSALEIDSLLGVGVAYQVGKVSVSYQVSSSVGTTTELYIVPIKKITVQPPSEILSNIKRENASFIRVSFEGDNKNSPSPHCYPQTSLFSPNIPFTCLLSFDSVLPNALPRNIFTATASYIPGEGFGCLLESLFDSDLMFATSGVKLMLGVSVIKSGLQEDVETPLSDIPFLPAAAVEKTEVILTDIDQIATVVLHGSQNLLSSFTLEFDDRYITAQIQSIEETRCTLVISSKDAIWSSSSPLNPISLSVISSLTQQKIRIDVSFEKIGSDTCPDPGKRIGVVGFLLALASHYQSALFSLLCLAVTVVCLMFGYYTLASPGYKQTQNTSVFASSNLPPSPVSPGSSIRNRSAVSLSPASSGSPPEASNLRHFPQSPKGIPLWSVDQEPVYGDPLFRSSPRPAYDGSPTYSRTATGQR